MGNLIWLIGTICAVWVIYDVWSKNTRLSEKNKIIWTVCAIIFNIISAIVYYVLHKMKSSDQY